MRTRDVTWTVDVPDDVSDQQIRDRFAALYAGAPPWPGWWVNPAIRVDPPRDGSPWVADSGEGR